MNYDVNKTVTRTILIINIQFHFFVLQMLTVFYLCRQRQDEATNINRS